jgi:predicted nuclease with TOPRIM domain
MTNQPRPTPGPWKHAHGFICDNDDVILAHIDRRCGTDETVRANAELIARAPELQQRAEWAEGALDKMNEVVKQTQSDNARLRELLKQCREYVPVDLQDFIDGASK